MSPWFKLCCLQLNDNGTVNVFFLEQIVMVYLRDRGHLPVKVIKKFISYTDCIKCPFFWPLPIKHYLTIFIE